MTPPALLMYDGDCGLCDWWVGFVLARDPGGRIHFAPLAGPTAASVRARHPEWPEGLDSLVLEVDGRLTWWSDSVIGLGDLLGIRWLSAIRWVPRPLRDAGYRLMASWRITIFGRPTSCRMPTPGIQERFPDGLSVPG